MNITRRNLLEWGLRSSALLLPLSWSQAAVARTETEPTPLPEPIWSEFGNPLPIPEVLA